jgi:hypothetical protein
VHYLFSCRPAAAIIVVADVFSPRNPDGSQLASHPATTSEGVRAPQKAEMGQLEIVGQQFHAVPLFPFDSPSLRYSFAKERVGSLLTKNTKTSGM